jgi:prepilin-type N-terminal cleavage/methylation domain-containing protein
MSKNSPKKNLARVAHAGFTLLEMLIALGIVVILTSITMESITKSRSQTSLNQAAQELTLLLREVQQKGISVSAVKVESSNLTFFPSHGIRVNISSTAEKKKVTIFPDFPVEANGVTTDNDDDDDDDVADSTAAGNKRMNTSGTYREDTYNPPYFLNSRVIITAIRYDNAGIPTDIPGGELNIIYHRPDPTVYFSQSGGSEAILGSTQHAWICLSTTDGTNLKRKIDVWKTGQISLSTSGSSTDCPNYTP